MSVILLQENPRKPFPLNLQPGSWEAPRGARDLTERGNLQNLSQFPAFSAVSTAPWFNPTCPFLQLSIYTPSAIRVQLIWRCVPLKMGESLQLILPIS